MSCLHGGTHHQSGIEFTFALHSIKTFSIFFFQSECEIRARTFQFELSEPGGPGGETEAGVQFPANADPVLNVIYKLRGLSPAQEAAVGGHQPPEAATVSPAASSAASNSDSGIGYREEAPHHQVGLIFTPSRP